MGDRHGQEEAGAAGHLLAGDYVLFDRGTCRPARLPGRTSF